MKKDIKDENLEVVADNCLTLLKKTKITGQTKAAKKIFDQYSLIMRELKAASFGFDTIVYKSDIEKFITDISKHPVKIIELENFTREVDDSVMDKLMIAKENELFEVVATALRNKYESIYIIGAEISDTPPKFPAVSFVQTNNATKTQYSTFDSLENVVGEDYKAEVYSNLSKGKEAQTKEITSVISDVMRDHGYERTFCEIVPNADSTINRRMSRYRKNNVI